MHVATSPGAVGRVVEAQTRRPVAGAEVFVSRATSQIPTAAVVVPPSWTEVMRAARPPTVVTDADGRFRIAPERHWRVHVVGRYTAEPGGTLVVRRGGFEDAMRPLDTPPYVVRVGEVWLKPAEN